MASVHEAAFGETYGDSCKQVLGVSGVIPDEYFDGLERLRARLCLSEEAAAKQYAKVARNKVKAYGDKAVEQLEAKAKAAQKKDGEGSGEVMGASLVAELLQLVEYARGARLLKEVDGKQVCDAVLRGQFAESMIKELYRQSLIEGFSGENTDNEKLFTSLEPLSVCIGLDAYEVAEIQADRTLRGGAKTDGDAMDVDAAPPAVGEARHIRRHHRHVAIGQQHRSGRGNL